MSSKILDQARAEATAGGAYPKEVRTAWITVLAIAFLSVLVRVPLFAVPMISDEGGYAYVAHFMSSDYQLYRDIPFYRPQAIFYLYQIIQAFGDDVRTLRLVTALYNAASVCALFFLTRLVTSWRLAAAAATMFAVFGAAPTIEGFTANAEVFAQLPMILAAICTWRRKWAWAGLMAALAVLLKPSGLSALLLAFAWAFLTGASLRGASRVAAAFGLALIPSILHGAMVGWQYYWDSIVTARVAYAGGTFHLGEQVLRFGGGALRTIPSWGVPAALAGASVSRPLDQPRQFGLLWLGASLVGMAMGGFWWEHYFIQAIPPLAFLAAVGLPALTRGKRRWFWGLPIAAAVALFSYDVWVWTRKPEEVSWLVFGRADYVAADEIAQIIKANSKPEETIFVGFSGAQIYYLADRKAAYPRMYYADFYYSDALFEGAMESIRKGESAVLVVTQPPPPDRMTWEGFMELVGRRYELVTVIDHGPARRSPVRIFRRKVPS